MATPDVATHVRDRGATRRRRATIAVGATLVATAVALGVLRSPLFGAHHLIVDGEHRLAPARVLELAGLGPGDNLVWLDEHAAARRLEDDPWVSSATVTADLPGTIRVSVSERTPVGAVQTHDGWQVVAADGVVLATPASRPRLPMITSIVPGDDVTAEAAGLLGAMSPDLRSRVRALTVSPGGLVHLTLPGDVPVTYGDVSDAVAKAQALEAILAWADDQRSRVEGIDVSTPGAPTARFAGGTISTP